MRTVAAISLLPEDRVHNPNESDNEDTYLDQVRICNVHWHFTFHSGRCWTRPPAQATSILSSGGLVPPETGGQAAFRVFCFPTSLLYITKHLFVNIFFSYYVRTSASGSAS